MRKPAQEVVSARTAWALQTSADAIGVHVNIHRFFPDLDSQGKDGFILLNQQIQFVRHILEHPGEAIGLNLGINLPFDGLGFWGFLLRSSPTFGDMLARAERYIRIVNKYSEFALEARDGRVAQICAHPSPSPFGPREQVVQCFLSHWLAWGRQLCNLRITPVEASFTWHGPQNTQPFLNFYGCPINFNASEDSLLFDQDALQTPLVDSTPLLAEEFERYATALVERMTVGDNLMSRVSSAIEEGLMSGKGRETDVAEKLAMTVRTLHRKLKVRDTSFRVLRDAVLRQKATDLLGQKDIPMSEVSFLLGYSDASTFCRAFKRWTGIVPNAWRARNNQAAS